MLLAYLDESDDKNNYYVTALVIKDSDLLTISNKFDKLVEFASARIDGVLTNAELHGYDLAWGSGDWSALKGRVKICAAIYERAIDIIASCDVKIASRGVNMPALRARYKTEVDFHSIALTFVLERIETIATNNETVALVIADEVGAKQSLYRKDFKGYQRNGTWGYKSKKLEHLVDTIHFAPSVSSRLIQAADLVSYVRLQKDKVSANPTALQFYKDRWRTLLNQDRVFEDSLWNPSLLQF